MFCSHVGENCWGNSISIHVESKISRHGKDQRLQNGTFWVCVCMACRPGVGQHSHVTRSQHVGLHVGPATVISNTMFAGLQTACRLDVGWMSAGCRPVSAMRFPLQPFLALCKPKTPPWDLCASVVVPRGCSFRLPVLTKLHKAQKKAAAKVIHVLKNT